MTARRSADLDAKPEVPTPRWRLNLEGRHAMEHAIAADCAGGKQMKPDRPLIASILSLAKPVQEKTIEGGLACGHGI
jgi:hypothetical protein